MTGDVPTVYVSVRDGNQSLVDEPCRAVTYPDGRPAVVWRGQAFPLLQGDAIDVSGEFRAPNECSTRRVEGRPTGPCFALIDGDAEAYVLLDGTVADREGAASALSSDGLKVVRSGRHLGGAEATWFIRFEKPAACDDLEARISRVLKVPRADGHVAPVAEVGLRLRLVSTELAAARGREAGLRREVDRLRAGSTAGQPASVPEAMETEIETFRLALDEEHRLRQEAEAALAAAIAALAAAPRRGPAPPRRAVKDIEAAFDELLPRVSLLGDSLGFVVAEMSDRRALFRCLRELQEKTQGMPPGWKGVQGADGWWERHVSTGQDDAGRIYARKSVAEARWSVLVSHKGDQTRDIARLRRLPH